MDGEKLTGATAIGVLGVALTAMFLGVEQFWIVFVIGYAVVLPLVAILTGAGEEAADEAAADEASWHADEAGRGQDVPADSKADALELLRERYARGELDDEQFDRKLERLLGTETLEDARDAVAGRDDERVPERE